MLFTELASGNGVMPIATQIETSQVMWPDIPPPQKVEASLAENAGAAHLNLAGIAEMDYMWPDIPPPKK